jgi:signal transduction histidine kinase
MRIHDNGKGFDIERAKEKGMMGLVNMMQRAKLLNGELTIITQNDKGCTITLLIGNLHQLLPIPME